VIEEIVQLKIKLLAACNKVSHPRESSRNGNEKRFAVHTCSCITEGKGK
jgi:hypothetical protein